MLAEGGLVFSKRESFGALTLRRARVACMQGEGRSPQWWERLTEVLVLEKVFSERRDGTREADLTLK